MQVTSACQLILHRVSGEVKVGSSRTMVASVGRDVLAAPDLVRTEPWCPPEQPLASTAAAGAFVLPGGGRPPACAGWAGCSSLMPPELCLIGCRVL